MPKDGRDSGSAMVPELDGAIEIGDCGKIAILATLDQIARSWRVKGTQ